jgi:hypothetical protein
MLSEVWHLELNVSIAAIVFDQSIGASASSSAAETVAEASAANRYLDEGRSVALGGASELRRWHGVAVRCRVFPRAEPAPSRSADAHDEPRRRLSCDVRGATCDVLLNHVGAGSGTCRTCRRRTWIRPPPGAAAC